MRGPSPLRRYLLRKYAATPDAGTAPRNAPPEFYSDIPLCLGLFGLTLMMEFLIFLNTHAVLPRVIGMIGVFLIY